MSNWTIIGKYLSKNTSERESEEIENRLIVDSVFRADFEKAKVIWKLSHKDQVFIPDFEKEWWRLRVRIESSLEQDNEKTKLRSLYWRLPVAASVLLLSFYLGYLSSNSINMVSDGTSSSTIVFDESILNENDFPERGSIKKEFFEVLTTSDSKSFYLPDSTYVRLSPGSGLRFAENFGIDHRNLDLDGEAFFDVKRDTTCAFEINAENTYTTVLGTSFNLRAYQEEDTVTLLVQSGLVAFNTPKDSSYFLKLGEYLTYYKEKDTAEIKKSVPKTIKNKIIEPLAAKNRRKIRKNVKNQLYLNSKWKKNAINQIVVFGSITNNSDSFSIGKIKLKVSFKTEEDVLIGTRYILIEDIEIKPNRNISYKEALKQSRLSKIKDVQVEIFTAEPLSVYGKQSKRKENQP